MAFSDIWDVLIELKMIQIKCLPNLKDYVQDSSGKTKIPFERFYPALSN